MAGSLNALGLGLLLAVVTSACGPPPAARQAALESRSEVPAGPKRATVVVPNELSSLYFPLAPASTRSGGSILYDLIHPGLSAFDNEGRLHPLMVDRKSVV